MTHRPYPSLDRARHQLDRHDDETPPLPDGSNQPPALLSQPFISEEARQALGARLAEVGASLRSAFQRPVGTEEKTG
jgi:hypothetical protein